VARGGQSWPEVAKSWRKGGQKLQHCATPSPWALLGIIFAMMTTTFPWSTALVTGASSGIGADMARILGGQSIPTVIVARREDRLIELATEFPSLTPLVADLETREGVEIVCARIASPEQPIDLLVNNAGFGIAGNFVDVSSAHHQSMVNLNVSTLLALTHAAVGPMVQRRHGWILQVSSMASFQPGPSSATYSATKAFVTNHSEALHEELRGTGVVVTALCPGFTRTEFHQRSGGGDQGVPNAAWLSSPDVAASGLRAAAAGRALDVPGAAYKGLRVLTNSLPRTATRRIMGVLSKK
jgi:uncharacterized protein